MSDDPTPPLRVKPRLAVASEPGPQPAAPGSAETPSADAGPTFKLRPPVPPPATTVPFVHPFLPEPSETKPAPAAPAAPPASLPPENSSPFVPPVSASSKPPLPPPPAPTPKKVTIHIRAPKSPTDDVDYSGKPPAANSPAEKKPGKTRRIALGAVLVTVLAAGGFFAYRLNFPPAPSTAKIPAAAKSPATTPPTPSDTLNALASAPGNAVSQAQATINAGRAASQARIDSLTGGEAPVAQRPTPRPTPVVTTAVPLSPGITMAVPDESTTAAAASPAFRSFVADAKIGGVRANATPPSALINNRLVRVGQPVDNGLGITIILSAANADTRELTFKDKSGATVTRRY